jgi:hypothetical protein|tara:strand:+ start:39 stop:1853 length:1815 start_codon:yes stop_codon:yes gene_type:complete
MQYNQERVDEIIPKKETIVKQKLVDKINSLGADAGTTTKDLTYLSKSLEVLNKKVKEDTFIGGTGPDCYGIRPIQQEVPNNSMPGWNTGKGEHRNASPAQFGIYTSHYSWSCGVTIYDEKCEPMTNSSWTWCHHYGGQTGGQWGPWSTGQRSACFDWNGNNCYFNTAGSTSSHNCYNNGADSCGPHGNSNLIVSPAATLSTVFWKQDNDQASGIGMRHEKRNEQIETGNYEPTDKYTYLVYQNQTIRLRNKAVMPGAADLDYSQKATINGDTAAYGSVTHNAERKEIAVLNRNNAVLNQEGSTGYYFDTRIYKNVPNLNLTTDLGVVLDNATSATMQTKIDDGGGQGSYTPISNNGQTLDYTVNARSVYAQTLYDPGERAEGHQGMKIVMVDTGDIYWSITHSTSHSLHRCNRYTVDGVTDDDYFAEGFIPVFNKHAAMVGYKGQDQYLNDNVVGYDTRTEVVDYHYCNNNYGREAGTSHPNGGSSGCGHVNIMSRNHRNVILQSPFYYYGCGMSAWLIDKRFSRQQIAWYVRSTSYGGQWGPFGEEGFVASYSRNKHGSDAAYRLYVMRQDQNTGTWMRSEMSRAMASTVPNNTTYPTLIPIL